jgi:hypothetical protein
VVTDGGRAVVGGAAKAWPGAELRRCEYHLAPNLVEVLPQRVRDDPRDELNVAGRRAQRSVEDWDAYRNLLPARAAQENGFAGAMARSAGSTPSSAHRPRPGHESGRTPPLGDLLPARGDHHRRPGRQDDEQAPRRRAG